MRYADGPAVEVETQVAAPPAVVWAAVTDIDLPARFSEEFQGGEWLDEQRFVGRNRHPLIGDWQTTCVVIEREDERVFAYAVTDPENPSATWRFELEPVGGGTRLVHSARLGPAPSGLSAAIERRPDKEERIIERRLEEHRANMTRTVEGIKALVEGG